MSTFTDEGIQPPQRLVKAIFARAITKAYPFAKDEGVIISTPKAPNRGEFQCNNAMSLFKKYKSSFDESVRTPEDVAKLIVDALGDDRAKFSFLDVAKAGFISMEVEASLLKDSVGQLLAEGMWARDASGQKMVAIDYSAPNIAKEMHVGHLRSTIHGESLSRILEYVGHKVERINHLGDWGTQFGMLIEYMLEQHPDFESNPPPLSDLNVFYKASKKRFEESEDFKKRARQMVVKLQGGDEMARRVWRLLIDISCAEFEKIYQRLDTSALIPRGESFYNDMLPTVLKMCVDAGIAKVVDGATVIFVVNDKGVEETDYPLILAKSDGGFGYDSTDMAAAYHRLITEPHDWCIYVTDLGQAPHFHKVFHAARMMGWRKPEQKMTHVGLGVVRGLDGKRFRTREGDTVKLVDLLDEAVNRSYADFKVRIAGRNAPLSDANERSVTDVEVETSATETPPAPTSRDTDVTQAPSATAVTGATTSSGLGDEGETFSEEDLRAIASKLGFAAVKYFDMYQNCTGGYIFTYDDMLSTTGNTAVYLIYSYARICAIFRKAGYNFDADMSPVLRDGVDAGRKLAFDPETFKLTTPEEKALVMHVLSFNDVIEQLLTSTDLSVHRICTFLYETAIKFSDFYQRCKVLQSPEQQNRLIICAITLKAMKRAFDLLSIEPLEKI